MSAAKTHQMPADPQRRALCGGLAGIALAALAPAVVRAQPPVELRMSWWGGNEVHRAQLKCIELFEQRHPGIRISAEYTGWAGYLERLTTQIAGGTAPDLIQINWNWLTLFSRDGDGFYDMNQLSDLIRLPAFSGDGLAMGTVAGRLNALPPTLTGRLFWFNKTTWDRAGLTLPKSWDELMAAGPVFRDKLGPEYYPLDLNLQDVVALTTSWAIQQTGEPLIDERPPQLNMDRDMLTRMAGLYDQLVRQHVVPDARTRASYGNVQRHELRPWINGQFAGVYEWSSAIGKSLNALAPGQELVLGPYLMLPGASDSGLFYKPGMMVSINRQSQHVRETARLLDFLLNDPEATAIMGLKRGVPDSRLALASLRQSGELHGLSWEGTQQIATLPKQVRFSGWFEHPRVRDGFIDIYERLGYGVIDVAEAGEEMDHDINRILRRVVRA